MALGIGLALGAGLLSSVLGGNDSPSYDTSIVQPDLKPLPLQNELTSSAQQTIYANTPWMYNPWRAMDYFGSYGTPQDYSPQFTPGALPQYPVGGQGYLGNFGQGPISAGPSGFSAGGQAPAPAVPGQYSWNTYVPTQQAPQGGVQSTQGVVPQTAPAGASYAASQPQASNATAPVVNSGAYRQGSGGTSYDYGILGAGAQNPYFADQYGIFGAMGTPSQELTNQFLPDVFANPYLTGINQGLNTSNWASQAVPAAAAFNQGLYSPGMTQMEQAYAGAMADLASRNLNDTQNRIEGMFENSTSHSALAPALLDAANQANMQLNRSIGQMGTQRQSLAASAMPFSFGFPLQATQASQQSSEGLYGMANAAKFGEMSYPLSVFGSIPYAAPAILSQPN